MSGVEQLARDLCRAAGYDPDDTGIMGPPATIATPAGAVVRVAPRWLQPLWINWIPAAIARMDAVAKASTAARVNNA